METTKLRREMMKRQYSLPTLAILVVMFILPAGANAARPSLANLQAQIDALASVSGP